MKFLFSVVILLTLPGCSTLLQAYADQANREDPCQMRFKPEGHVKPSWCHSSQGRILTVTPTQAPGVFIIQQR